MSFAIQNLSRVSASGNAGKTDGGEGGIAIFTYRHATDNKAAIMTADYFGAAAYNFSVGDLIMVDASDGFDTLQVATLDRSAGTMTVSSLQVSADISIEVTAAEFIGMYAAPKEIIAAQGANTIIDVVGRPKIELNYGTTQFTNGGVVLLQYDSTIHGAGSPVTGDIAAAGFTGATADTVFAGDPSVALALASVVVNKGVYLSNKTAAFATGDSTFVVHVGYRVISTSF